MNLTHDEYGLFKNATSGADWTPAHNVYRFCDDYRQRVQMSGLWFAVVLKWFPGLVTYAEPAMTDAEVSSMGAIDGNPAFLAWWSALLSARGGSVPSDFVARVVDNNLLRDVVDSYSEPIDE